jgi:hypothetical protein
MITGICAFIGAMLGAVVINYVLHAPDDDDQLYRNDGHHGSKN